MSDIITFGLGAASTLIAAFVVNAFRILRSGPLAPTPETAEQRRFRLARQALEAKRSELQGAIDLLQALIELNDPAKEERLLEQVATSYQAHAPCVPILRSALAEATTYT